jgi:hypothetical protein
VLTSHTRNDLGRGKNRERHTCVVRVGARRGSEVHRLSAGYETVEFVIPRSRLRAARCCLMKSEVPLEGVLRVRARRMAVEGLANATPIALAPY